MTFLNSTIQTGSGAKVPLPRYVNIPMGRPIKHYGKWRIRWTDHEGKRQSANYDRFSEAEIALKTFEVESARVRNGLASPRQKQRTFQDLSNYWLTHRNVHKKNPRDDMLILRVHLLPIFGSLKLADITVEKIDRFKVFKFKTLKPKTINNHLTLLVSMMNLAKDLGWLITAPKTKKFKTPLFDKDFRYLRTNDEIFCFLSSADNEHPMVYSMYACAIYTGLREGELAALRWSDVDMSRRLITVQRSFDGSTKSGDVRYVPILDPLLPILRTWRLQSPNEVVFPNRDGNAFKPCEGWCLDFTRKKIKSFIFPIANKSEFYVPMLHSLAIFKVKIARSLISSLVISPLSLAPKINSFAPSKNELFSPNVLNAL